MTFTGEIIPKVGFVIVADDWLIETKATRRIHNRVSKSAGRAVMLIHWKTFFPMHFKQVNRNRYGHAPREEGYKTQKKFRFNSIIDLVKTGRTKDYMLTIMPRIQVGGKAENLMIVHMYMKWPFPGGEKGNAKIDREQMNRELETWVSEEESFILQKYHELYVADFRKETARRPKIRKRFNQRISA